MYSEKLESLRTRIGLTQKEVGQLINLDSGTYCHYEKEDLIIPLKHLITLCNYYDVSLDYIFSFSNKKKYNNLKTNIDIATVGKNLLAFRKKYKLTQEQLAEILNTPHSVLSDYEHGKRLIPTHALFAICKKYKISADYLLGRIDKKPF